MGGNNPKLSRNIRPVAHPARLSLRDPLANPICEPLRSGAKGNRRVMLLVPPYTRFPGKEMKRASEPLGLLRVGSELHARGWDVRITDAPCEGFDHEVGHQGMVRYGLPVRIIEERIRGFDPAYVGISCLYTKQWGNVREMADLVKSIDPRIVVVLGGSHPSGDYYHALADSPADYVVRGEGEATLPELLDALRHGLSVKGVRGIAFRTDEEADGVHATPPRGFSDINSFCMNRRDLLDPGVYSRLMHTAGRRETDGGLAYLMTTKGCNTGCTFCLAGLVQGPYRESHIKRVEEELRDLRRRGIREIILEDDNLLHNPARAMKVAGLLGRHGFRWVEEGGLALFRMLNPGRGIGAQDIIDAFSGNGCYRVYLAVESANKESLGRMNKPQSNAREKRKALRVVERFAEAGISVVGGFMLGFLKGDYQETRRQISRTIKYARQFMEHGMDFANFFIVTPFPGTRDFGLQKGHIVRDYDWFSHEMPVMACREWSIEDMEGMYDHARRSVNGDGLVDKVIRSGNWACKSDFRKPHK